jgi:hypothetical protein
VKVIVKDKNQVAFEDGKLGLKLLFSNYLYKRIYKIDENMWEDGS